MKNSSHKAAIIFSTSKDMKSALCSFLIFMQIVNWGYSTRTPFTPNDAPCVQQPGQKTSIPHVPLKSNKGIDRRHQNAETLKEEAYYKKGVSKIGSTRPSCEHKCFGCMPCEAVQIPTTSRQSNMGVQYANYEPEGWKCKCGPSFYSP